MRQSFLSSAVAGLLLLATIPATAQIQYDGKPLLAGSRSFSPSMDYLLEVPDPYQVEAENRKNLDHLKKNLTFALIRETDISPVSGGEWLRIDDTDVWRVRIISPGAYSLGVNFNQFQLLPGEHLYVYDGTGEFVKGSFDYRNNRDGGYFIVTQVPGDEIVVELQADNGRENIGQLNIESVSHAFLPVPTDFLKDYRFEASGECEIDINCEEGENWQLVKHSVCRIYTTTEYCTGVLVNNTSVNGTPYVLTAEHCINKESVADKTVYTFNYESPSCFGTDGSIAQSLTGSSLVATGGDLDFSLLLLDSPIPEAYNVYYAGWDLDDSPPYLSTVIHHPQGDVKKISMDYDYATIAQTVQGDLNDYIAQSLWKIYQWDYGTTEGGSSGSPLFNIYRRIVGTLTGGAAVCGDSIDYDEVNDRVLYDLTPNVNDYFTRIGYVWDYYSDPAKQLKYWLDPTGTGKTYLNGYDPNAIQGIGPESGPGILLLPNPARDWLKVDLEGLPGPVYLSVFDVSGKKVLETVTGDSEITLAVGNLPPGAYLFIAANSTHNYRSKLIIAR